ncbi:asparaginase [Streptomyces sp. DSM 44917]|uniref:Asparaginase n=2 Tax=Streptomyces boetiae TaxID=3075541 RepID=A0ABU2L7G9_9ACTN|nr:asparaginase [Streptomyces sp. DSM 44917]MDT0307518.1 asparaginase [Streptomyces sp. DSM 44917]
MLPDSQVSRRNAVLVLTLGGTIAMAGDGPGGVAPRLTGADLVAAVPGLAEEAAVEVEDFRQVPSAGLTVEDVAELAGRVEKAGAEGFAGVVITQGTDTLEETSFLLDLLYRGEAPVVLTGAMRHPGIAGADGPANLLAAVRTAASPVARHLGVLVVFNDEIHAARWVRKTHATSPGAFSSPNAGPIGRMAEGAPRVHATPEGRPTVGRPLTRRVKVEVVTAALGSDGVLLDGLADRVNGVVVAAFGAGHVPESWVAGLGTLAARLPVVLASRTGAGGVLSRTYAFPGSESDLLARGLISAGTLDPYKARLLLLAHLAAGSDRATIVAAFADHL